MEPANVFIRTFSIPLGLGPFNASNADTADEIVKFIEIRQMKHVSLLSLSHSFFLFYFSKHKKGFTAFLSAIHFKKITS